jgi:hypothetical protein
MTNHNPVPAGRRRLEVGKILLGAFVVPWQRRAALGRSLMLPAGALLLIDTLLYATGSGGGLVYQIPIIVVQALVYTLFAVTCHRVILLGDDSVPRFGLASWSARETRFFGWMIGMYLVFAVASLIPLIVLASVLSGFSGAQADAAESTQPLRWAMLAASIPGAYVMARLCLVLPATAVDRKVNFPWSWERTASNGWRMAVVAGALPWLVSIAQGALAAQSDSTIVTAAASLIGLPLLAVEVTALSLCYHTLTTGEGV